MNAHLSLLLLGGTGEARELAMRLTEKYPTLQLTHSLAGLTCAPPGLAGTLRRGGFGGTAGLAVFLRQEAIALVIDATHPYAATITMNAAAATAAAGIPLIRLARPPWTATAHDTWISVPDAATAANRAQAIGGRLFLTLGQRSLAPFQALSDQWIVWRTVTAPAAPPFRHGEVIVARGPFSEADELALLTAHKIDVMVSRNSGGAATYGKIAAAQKLALPVIMIERPDHSLDRRMTVTETVPQTLAAVDTALNRLGIVPL